MTKLEPRLSISRLVVLEGENVAYDETFHARLNIIRGDNSSGKSSIADFLCFGLGGDVTAWRSEAKQCTTVYTQVLLNSAAATLKREMGGSRKPMSVYWGDYDHSRSSSETGWESYPYAQSGSKVSFSAILFSALGIPEVRGALAARITMHQLLRVMYVDQLTPADQIFRLEAFDTDLIREVVGSLICGLYDAEFYDLEVALRSAQSELDATSGQIRAEEKLLGKYASPSAIRAKLESTKRERENQQKKLSELESTRWTAARLNTKQRSELDQLERDLHAQVKEAIALRATRDDILYEVADSDLFLLSLKQHLDALDDSTVVRETLGESHFGLCPACYALVAEPSTPSQCSLCKSVLTDEKNNSHVARLRTELAQQLAESRSLQQKRTLKLQDITSEVDVAAAKEKQLRLRYATLALSASPGPDGATAELNRKLGYLDREIEDLDGRLRSAETLNTLRQRVLELTGMVESLQKRKEEYETERRDRAFSAHSTIAQRTLELLGKDLEREEGFGSAKNLRFDFAKNLVLVDGEASFSASSMVFLKNCFHLAILIASTEQAFFRYPRFLLMDNVEDKGMEERRSHNFQRMVAQWSAATPVEHQVILTTSKIAPDLDLPKYTVGAFYSKAGRKTLNINRRSS